MLTVCLLCVIIIILLLLVPKFEGNCINASSGRKSHCGQFETYTDKVVLQWRWNVLTSNVGPWYNADVRMRISHVQHADVYSHDIYIANPKHNLKPKCN